MKRKMMIIQIEIAIVHCALKKMFIFIKTI